ncbi:alanine racemase [Kaarinaea lacus]
MSRAAQAIINLSALQHNLRVAKRAAPSTKNLAVIKANGYGHGIVRVANALHEADAFAVASLEEALTLRQAGVTKSILLLEGFFSEAELSEIQQQQLDIVIHHESQLQVLKKHSARLASSPLNVWLKIDTGMHRLGFAPEYVQTAWQQLQSNPAVAAVTLMTHLANADDRNDDFTLQQLQLFDACTKQWAVPRSIANSAGILAWPTSHADIVRPGIMLYGSTPFISGTGEGYELQPVMTLTTELIAINRLKQGDRVGYGGQWVCPEDMSVGVAAIGYGDGYPRHATTGTPVLVNRRRTQIVGRVSMDMVCVDLRGLPAAQVGDSVVLWGDGLPIEEVARHAATISYELMCGVSQRVQFVEKQ